MINPQIYTVLSLIYSCCYGILAFLIFHYAIPALRAHHRWHALGVWGIGVVVGLFSLARLTDALEYRTFALNIYLIAHPVLIGALSLLLYRASKIVKGNSLWLRKSKR